MPNLRPLQRPDSELRKFHNVASIPTEEPSTPMVGPDGAEPATRKSDLRIVSPQAMNDPPTRLRQSMDFNHGHRGM